MHQLIPRKAESWRSTAARRRLEDVRSVNTQEANSGETGWCFLLVKQDDWRICGPIIMLKTLVRPTPSTVQAELLFELTARLRASLVVARQDGAALGQQAAAEESQRFKMFHAQEKPSERQMGPFVLSSTDWSWSLFKFSVTVLNHFKACLLKQL